MAPKNKKGWFVKKGHGKQVTALSRGRNTRWNSDCCSSSNLGPILFAELDHSYDSCSVNKDPVYNVSRQEDIVTTLSNDEEPGWRTGRRVIELGTLADGLKACKLCSQPLHLINTVGERKFGLAQILEVKCTYSECGLVNDIPTGSNHKTENGGQAWDVNTKLAAGMINGGFGETHINSILAALNIPSITQKALKRGEREVGHQLNFMADESCKKQLNKELEMSDGKLTVSFDGAWQKRGTGHAYNSLTGHATLFGKKTKKCIKYAVKGQRCRICDAAKDKGVCPRKHNCSRNWSGSSKAMEPAMACEMVQSIYDDGEKVDTLVMDNDSTTIARLKATVDNTISKQADKNHTKKGFTNALFELSNNHKILKNTKVRNHIEKCFIYCVSQNEGKPKEIADGLQNIVPHLYGEHDGCGLWCKNEKKDYKPRNLPFGKPLNCPNFRHALENLFLKYAAKADELASLRSTQVNENFNHMVSSKAPKRLFYGGSESLKTRLSATVCQKNDGHNYITELNKKCSVSPGQFTLKHAQKMEKRLKNQRLRQSLFTSKRRRLELKSLRAMKNSTQSVLEGDTYQSKIGIEEDLDLEDIDLTPVSFPKDGSEIIFDLETTGLARTSDIIQIAAASGDEEFSIYMTPTTEISIGASEATGLTYVGGVLKHRGQAVSCVTPQEGLSQFLNFIKKFSKPILVGHNIQSFDLPVLINQLSRYNLYTDFQKTVFGFIDTLKVAKRTWKRPEVENYKQETLVRTFLDLKYDAHNALADVQSLQRLYKKMMANCLLSSDLFTLNYYACKQSLDPLVKDKVISSQTMKKLLQCSLSLSKLRSIHKRDTFNGIRNVFVEQCEGSKVPRISKSKAVIEKLITYLNT